MKINQIIVSVKAIHKNLVEENEIKKIFNSFDEEKIKSILKKKIISKIK